MVMRYVHLSADHIDTAIAAMDTAFLDTITPELHTRLERTPRSAVANFRLQKPLS